MKRAWLVLFLIVFVIGGAFAWWFLRDTPEKALRDGFLRLFAAQSARSLIADVAWTSPKTRVTTGFAFAGRADTKDLTRPRALGVLRLAEGVVGEEQTADVVLEQDAIALRPRSVSSTYREMYEDLVGDREGERFLVISRDPFLNRFQYANFVAHGQSVDLRANLPSLLKVATVSGPWKKAGLPGRRTVAVPFRLDEAGLRPFLVSLVQLWSGDNATPEEVAWVNRTAAGLARGSFVMTVNRDTRDPILLEGQWPMLDEKNEEVLRLRAGIEVDGLNQRVTIGIPEGFKDVTEKTMKQKSGSSLPTAAFKTLPEAQGSSGTGFGTDGVNATGSFNAKAPNMINEDDVDLFHKYLEELKNKKSGY